MKKIFLLTTYFFISLVSFGQQIDIGRFGTTKISGKIAGVSAKQISAFAKMKLHDQIPSPGYLERDSTKIYTVGNILVTIYARKLKKKINPDTSLMNLKEALRPFFSDIEGYNSNIESINGNKYLITRQPIKGNITKAFYAYNNFTLTTLQGSIQCAPEYEEEANITLKELLSNIVYNRK